MLRTQPDDNGIVIARDIGRDVYTIPDLGPVVGTTAFVAIEEGEEIVVALHAKIDAGDEIGKIGLGKDVRSLVIQATQGETCWDSIEEILRALSFGEKRTRRIALRDKQACRIAIFRLEEHLHHHGKLR